MCIRNEELGECGKKTGIIPVSVAQVNEFIEAYKDEFGEEQCGNRNPYPVCTMVGPSGRYSCYLISRFLSNLFAKPQTRMIYWLAP